MIPAHLKKDYPINPAAAHQIALRTVLRISLPLLILFVGLLGIRFSVTFQTMSLADYADEFIICLLYLTVFGFCLYASVLKFVKQATLRFEEKSLLFFRSRTGSPVENDAPDKPSKLSAGEQRIAYTDLHSASILPHGLILTVKEPHPLTGNGRLYIPSETDDYRQLLDQINVLGDRFQWEFPGERVR